MTTEDDGYTILHVGHECPLPDVYFPRGSVFVWHECSGLREHRGSRVWEPLPKG